MGWRRRPAAAPGVAVLAASEGGPEGGQAGGGAMEADAVGMEAQEATE